MASILYAEDDPSVASLVEFTLVDEGHDVTLARDGDYARMLLDGRAFDIVLLDVMMPGQDGLSLCRMITQRTDAPPVIIISAKDRAEDREAGFEAGATDYITKPFDPDILIDRIAELVDG